MDLLDQLAQELKVNKKERSVISRLGFFSKPFRMTAKDGQEWVVKTYKAIRNTRLIDQIIQNHKDYVEAMQKIGVKIPHTEIHTLGQQGKKQLVILQAPYQQEELVRGIMETAQQDQFLEILGLLLEDTLQFWLNKNDQEIGFHPTLRNYALRDGALFYFDTFPPMLMPQQQLNGIIVEMAPVKLNMRPFIPLSAINRVSDEYYEKDKMLIGIIGSCCRLRPEFTEAVLNFAQAFIQNHALLNDREKSSLITKIMAPPKLPAIWVFIRKLLGKQGKPNIK